MKNNINETTTEFVEAYSDWYHSESDATSECHDLLNDNADTIISDMESNDWFYIGSSDNGLNTTYDDSNDLYQTYGSKDLHFSKEEEDLLKSLDTSIEENSVEVDIDELITQKIEPLLAKNYLKYMRGTDTIPSNAPEPIKEVMRGLKKFEIKSVTLSNLIIEKSELILDKENPQTLPLNHDVKNIKYRNCTSSVQTLRGEKTFQIVKGYKIEFTKKLVSKNKISGSLKFGVKSISGEFKKEREITTEITNKTIQNVTTTNIVKHPYQLTVPKMTIIDGHITVTQNMGSMKYSGIIQINGKVNIEYYSRNGRLNGSHYVRVSDKLSKYIPLSIDRTLKLDGYLGDVSVEDFDIAFDELECGN